ncbi:hypothetical protein [Flavobacterium sp. LM4]|nr:hypothetical protein [Flavobacterium sp. LM4]
MDTTMALLALSRNGYAQAIAGGYFFTNFVLETTLDTNVGKIIENQLDGK